MKLFTLGPVEIYPETISVYQKGFPHFRTSEYGNLVKSILSRMAALVGTEFKDNIIYLTASGTAAMEASLENCFDEKDNLLVINGGCFGHRFCELCEHHGIPHDSVNLRWNEELTAEHLVPYSGKGYTALLVNLHETFTGQLYDIKLLRAFCRDNNMLLVVDAIGTFLADDYNMDENGIDLTIFSSQKGLSCSPGLSFVVFSERMLQRVNSRPTAVSRYFDFKDYLFSIPRGQTPYTPALRIMYEIEAILDLIDASGGKDAWLLRIQKKAEYFRSCVKKWGYTIPSYSLSNMLTPIYFDDVSAYDLCVYLKEHYQLYINPCGGDLAEKMFRIAHIGNTNMADIDDLLEKLNYSLQALRK